jgi:hypothetical protein
MVNAIEDKEETVTNFLREIFLLVRLILVHLFFKTTDIDSQKRFATNATYCYWFTATGLDIISAAVLIALRMRG